MACCKNNALTVNGMPLKNPIVAHSFANAVAMIVHLKNVA